MQTENEKKAVQRFWDKYINVVLLRGVKEPFDRWYVIRAEEFIRHCGDRRLAEQTPEAVTDYLLIIGRKTPLKPWQFAQTVDALQILFIELVTAPWARSFDWAGWKGSAKTLDPGHPPLKKHFRRGQLAAHFCPQKHAPNAVNIAQIANLTNNYNYLAWSDPEYLLTQR